MNSSFINNCISYLKSEEIQKEIKNCTKPIINSIFQELYPYIYLSLLLVIVSFFLILGIFILLMRRK